MVLTTKTFCSLDCIEIFPEEIFPLHKNCIKYFWNKSFLLTNQSRVLFSDGHVFNNAENLLLIIIFMIFIHMYCTYIPCMFFIGIQNTYVKDTFSNRYKTISNFN